MHVTTEGGGFAPATPGFNAFLPPLSVRLRFASTLEASAARLHRVRPRNRRSGRIPALPYPPSGLGQFTTNAVQQ
jgi:hypothetical protein